MNAERPVFYKTKEGFIAPKSLLVKVVPLVTECVDLMGFLTDVNPETHEWAVLLFDSGTGSVVAASKECYAKYGIPPCLCDGHRSRPKNINVTQLFQNCSLTELTEKGASKGMKTADTSFIENMGIERELLPKGEEVNAENVYKRHSVKIETKAEENFGEVDFGLIEIRFREYKNTTFDFLQIQSQNLKSIPNENFRHRRKNNLKRGFVLNDHESSEEEDFAPVPEIDDDAFQEEIKRAEEERKLRAKRSRMLLTAVPLSLRILQPMFAAAASILGVVLMFNIRAEGQLSESIQSKREALFSYQRLSTLLADLNYRSLMLTLASK